MFTIATGGSSTMMLGYMVFLVAIFYFLLIRPQQKQKKQRATMLSSLSVGDDIYTAGGILGTITRIKEQTIWLRISDKCEIELLKGSIGGLKTQEEAANTITTDK